MPTSILIPRNRHVYCVVFEIVTGNLGQKKMGTKYLEIEGDEQGESQNHINNSENLVNSVQV